mgnify:CR=1 FL=1
MMRFSAITKLPWLLYSSINFNPNTRLNYIFHGQTNSVDGLDDEMIYPNFLLLREFLIKLVFKVVLHDAWIVLVSSMQVFYQD